MYILKFYRNRISFYLVDSTILKVLHSIMLRRIETFCCCVLKSLFFSSLPYVQFVDGQSGIEF